MSKLDELIKELCPDGVEYKTLGEVTWQNRFKQVSADFLSNLISDNCENQIKLLPSSKNYDWWSNYDTCKNIYCDGEVITLGRARYANLKYHKGKFVSSNNHIIEAKSGLNGRFLYHLIALHYDKFYVETSTYPKFDNDAFINFKIPVPPLPVQEEIVRILDTFTQLTAELTAELTARRAQYEYYRDALLTRETKAERKKLGEIFYTRNGYTPSTSNPDYWDNGKIPWFVMDDIRKNGRILSDSIQHVTESAIKKSGLFPANSIIVSTSATIGEHALITTDFLCNQRFTCLYPKPEYKNKINMKFMLYYAFKLDEFCKKNTTKSSFASVDMSRFYDFEIPLPPLDVQERLVRVLDNFDAICSDLKIGLPAEIEARKKQYEFYRDSLLSFAETGRIAADNGGGYNHDLIRLVQYVFGYAKVVLSDIAKYSTERINAKEMDADTYVGVDNLLQNKAGKIRSSYVPLSGSLTKYNKGDVLIGNIRPYLRKIWFADNTGGTNGDVLVIHIASDLAFPKYLYHVLSAETFFAYDTAHSKGAKMPRGDKETVMKYEFDLPSIDEQKRIAEILDRFNALCNDISQGIPAEIEARRKQYEYYRDTLLSFSVVSTGSTTV